MIILEYDVIFYLSLSLAGVDRAVSGMTFIMCTCSLCVYVL